MQDDSLMEQSSYVMEHSIGTDMEFSMINRRLAEVNINRESTAAPKRSPFKMLKITGASLNEGGIFSPAQAPRNDTINGRSQGMIENHIQNSIFIQMLADFDRIV